MNALPRWFGEDRKRQNSRSRSQERRRAKERGGRPQAGSGSSWRARQDIKDDKELVQVKYTDKESFPLKGKELVQLFSDANLYGRSPSFEVEFQKHGIRATVTVERIHTRY